REISMLDVVKVSLDAANEDNFKRINRPHPGLDLACFTDGLTAFRKGFAKQLWVEVFLVPGCNDSEVELKEIKNVINTLEPDRIQLNTLDRPGTESWVKPVCKKALTDIASYLYNAEIITHSKPEQNGHIDGKHYYERLLATIKRRPCTAEDVTRLLGIDIGEARRHLYALTQKGVIKKKEMPRGTFYMMPS
ncbi:radical SAM protein, partial [Thermodesulfobacteriota bacterium]